MREAAGDRFLDLQHAKRDAADFAGLIFHLAKYARGDPDGDHGAHQSQQQRAAQQPYGFRGEPLGSHPIALLRVLGPSVAEVDQRRDYRRDRLVAKEQIASGLLGRLLLVQQIASLVGKVARRAAQIQPDLAVRTGARPVDELVDLSVGLIQVGQHLRTIDGLGIRDRRKKLAVSAPCSPSTSSSKRVTTS